jgi:DNA polymerase III subunit delta
MKTVSEIIKTLQSKNYSPIYFLVGKEKFFHDQIINLLSNDLFTDPSSRSLNRIVLHGTENSLPQIVNAAVSYPMLSNYKLIIVKEFTKIKTSEAESFERYLDNPQTATILVLSADDPGKTKLFNKVKSVATVVDCKPILEYKVSAWIKQRSDEKKLNLVAPAALMLAEYTGNSLLGIDHELDKIKDFKADNSEITTDDIISITGMSKEYNVFTFQKALSEKDIKRSFLIAKNLMDSGENINLIISIVFSFFKKALIMSRLKTSNKKVTEISSLMKLNDFQMRDIQNTLNKFSQPNIEKILKLLNSVDKTVKTSAQTDWSVLQSMCYNICRQ